MRQRDRESVTDSDTHGLFDHRVDPAGDPGLEHDPRGSLLDDYDSVESDHGPGRRTRAEDRQARQSQGRRRGNRRFFAVLSVLLVAVVAVSAWLIVVPLYRYLNPADYAGPGSGTVLVTVNADDGATQIGSTLHDRGVVASARAFTDAAADNPASQSIQPGSYRLHRRMSAAGAVKLLLDPNARVQADVLVPEGATAVDIRKALTRAPCTARSAGDAVCGAGLSSAAVAKAFADVRALGLPTDYVSRGTLPSSPEGFLFPATYTFTMKPTASAALQQMISKFTEVVRAANFTAKAKALSLTPYQALIIASIAQSEAKFSDDFPKVARVILNRLAQHISLRVDATSAYAAKLKGLDPAKVIYAQIDSPYNTYTHSGLPPTPIGNPGVDAMTGAVAPAQGKWLFYVNADADGHLGFYQTEKQFAAAVDKCRTNHWGCA